MHKPLNKPQRPNFSSGPCVKFPEWSLNSLNSLYLGRSHKSDLCRTLIQECLTLTKKVLGIPQNYQIMITPGSATGSIMMALWNFLGHRPLTVIDFDVFAQRWLYDIKYELKISNIFHRHAPYGQLPKLLDIPFHHDIMCVWNATSTGVYIPTYDWLDSYREGLTLCDATSAAFGIELPWEYLDVTCFSWQKALGGEAAHGMMVLSPKAIARLEKYTPVWPIPYSMRLTENNRFKVNLTEGLTINTVSMMACGDYLQALHWAEKIGGAQALQERTRGNFRIIQEWVTSHSFVEFLTKDISIQSPITVCLRFKKNGVYLTHSQLKKICDLLIKEQAAYDIMGFQQVASNLRIWCGPTVEKNDIMRLLPWLEWAYTKI